MTRVLILLMVLVTACSATPVQPALSPPRTSQEQDRRMSAAELQAVWWTWVSSQPKGSSPVEDTSGRFCSRDQPKEVWLLAGSTGGKVERQCRIPADKPILVPAVNSLECDGFMAKAQGEVVLDEITQELIRIDVAGFTYTGRDGQVNAVGCGLWAWIAPPSAGEHTLVVRGSGGTDVTYRLIVGADLE